jgi:hypothetical protein
MLGEQWVANRLRAEGTSTGLEGFGGWLLLIAIGQWLGIFGEVVQLLLELPRYASQWSVPPMRRGIIGEVGLNIALLAFMFYTTVMMSMKRREFPTLFRVQLALLVVAPLLVTWWTSMSAGRPIVGLEFAATAARAVVGVMGASLYTLLAEIGAGPKHFCLLIRDLVI